jgi:hypothetical protein
MFAEQVGIAQQPFGSNAPAIDQRVTTLHGLGGTQFLFVTGEAGEIKEGSFEVSDYLLLVERTPFPEKFDERIRLIAIRGIGVEVHGHAMGARNQTVQHRSSYGRCHGCTPIAKRLSKLVTARRQSSASLAISWPITRLFSNRRRRNPLIVAPLVAQFQPRLLTPFYILFV